MTSMASGRADALQKGLGRRAYEKECSVAGEVGPRKYLPTDMHGQAWTQKKDRSCRDLKRGNWRGGLCRCSTADLGGPPVTE